MARRYYSFSHVEKQQREFWLCTMLVAFVMTGILLVQYLTVDEVSIVIKFKEKEPGRKDEKPKYMIHSQNESFECVDNILFWKFNSTDVYRDLDVGKRYLVKVNGFRITYTSSYRNILEIIRKY